MRIRRRNEEATEILTSHPIIFQVNIWCQALLVPFRSGILLISSRCIEEFLLLEEKFLPLNWVMRSLEDQLLASPCDLPRVILHRIHERSVKSYSMQGNWCREIR